MYVYRYLWDRNAKVPNVPPSNYIFRLVKTFGSYTVRMLMCVLTDVYVIT